MKDLDMRANLCRYVIILVVYTFSEGLALKLVNTINRCDNCPPLKKHDMALDFRQYMYWNIKQYLSIYLFTLICLTISFCPNILVSKYL